MELTTGLYCKLFRQRVLGLTLEELSDKHVSLRAFENDRSSNLNLINEYLVKCTEEQVKEFRLNIPYNSKRSVINGK